MTEDVRRQLAAAGARTSLPSRSNPKSGTDVPQPDLRGLETEYEPKEAKPPPTEEALAQLGRDNTPASQRYGRYAGKDSSGFLARRYCGLDGEQAGQLDELYYHLIQTT